MADEEDKVKLELDMPKDQVSIHESEEESGTAGKFVADNQNDTEELKQRQEKAVEVLKETRQELSKTKKEIKELKEKVEGSEEEDSDSGSLVKQTTGYELEELVGTPISPPEPEAKSKPKLRQLRLILVGFAVVFAGLIIWPIIGFSVGLSVIIIGAVFIAVGVLVRI